FDLRFSAGKVFVATEHGLWSGSPEKRIFTPTAQKSVIGKILSLDISKDGQEVWLVSTGGVFHSLDAGVIWGQAPFAEHGIPQWISLVPSISNTLLLGTTTGTFISVNSGSTWEPLHSGLPAVDSYPAAIYQNVIAIAPKVGGLYLSHDSGRNWTRADGTT